MGQRHRRIGGALLAGVAVVAMTVAPAGSAPAPTQPQRIIASTGLSGEDNATTQITDGVHAYVATFTSPARILKIRLSDMARVGGVTLNAGENAPVSAVSDGTHGYFATRTSPSTVVKVRLSDMTRVAAVTFEPGENVANAATTDGTFGYFGTETAPGRVVKVRLSNMTRVGAVTLNAGDSNLASAVTDGTHGYFGTTTQTGRLVKVRLSDMTRVGALTFQSGEDFVTEVLTDGTHAYIGTSTLPGRIVKVRMSDMTRVGSLTLNSGENQIISGTTDGTYGYFGLFSGPGKIVKVRLSDMTRLNVLTLNAGEISPASMVADATQAYVALLTAPVEMVKIRLAPDSTASCGFTDEAAIPEYARVGACWLKSNGITANDPYAPGDPVTRSQMAAFLWRAAGSPPAATSCGFSDAAAIPDYARKGACWLKVTGITANNPYAPGDVVTRAQMAAFLWRAAGSPPAATSCGFTDAAVIPVYARQGACWLKATGVTANNPYAPGDVVTRAQMAAFLNRQNTLPLS